MKILITGGAGFVGRNIIPRLLHDGHDVTAIIRDPNQLKSGRDRLRPVPGDVVKNIGITEAAKDQEAIIHLVGIIMEKDATFDQVHFEGTRNVVAAANRAGVRRIIHMSAFGARPDGVSAYQKSKFKAEEEVRNSKISYTILRPSIICGRDDGFVSQMVQIMKGAPGIRPVPGTGRYPFTPIYVQDVVECFVQSLSQPALTNQTVDLGGSEKLTLEEILTKIADCVGVRKMPVKIPMPLMRMGAALTSWLPHPPVTRDQLAMLQEGSAADITRMKELFHLTPTSFSDALKTYLCPAKTSA